MAGDHLGHQQVGALASSRQQLGRCFRHLVGGRQPETDQALFGLMDHCLAIEFDSHREPQIPSGLNCTIGIVSRRPRRNRNTCCLDQLPRPGLGDGAHPADCYHALPGTGSVGPEGGPTGLDDIVDQPQPLVEGQKGALHGVDGQPAQVS